MKNESSIVNQIQYKTETKEFRGQWIEFIYNLQDKICKALEDADGKAKFTEDEWQRAEGKGGGGLTRVIQNGNVFEKGGVNTSVVYGKLSRKMREVLHIPLSSDKETWFAAGISSVIHPVNPFVPTIHFNYRMFELYDKDGMVKDRWFGGGTDLTPYYLFEDDAKHFHSTLKNVCDKFAQPTQTPPKEGLSNTQTPSIQDVNNFTTTLKSEACAQNPFPSGWQGWAAFAKACGNAFIDAYIPIVKKRKNISYTEAHKHWQEIRRGRYVEFNLIHDKGTLFGLKTSGRTESILMSLPPTVRFEYNYQPEKGSEEEKLWQVCLKPREW